MRIKGFTYVLKLTAYMFNRNGGLINSLAKATRLYQQEGTTGIKRGFKSAKREFKSIIRNDYAKWVGLYDTISENKRQDLSKEIAAFACHPPISLVMHTFNPEPKQLVKVIESVQAQIYPYWELYISDDASTNQEIQQILNYYRNQNPRINVIFNEKNKGISSSLNNTLDLVSSEWIGLLYTDSMLSEHALFWMAQAINNNPDACLIYSDEDKIDESGQRFGHYFKCDWNPDLYKTHNFISHIGLYKKNLIKSIGGFRESFEEAHDYDLALRYTEQLLPQQIVHIHRILCHRYSEKNGRTLGYAEIENEHALIAGQRALNDHLSRLNISAKAEILNNGMYRTIYDVPKPEPLVSIIIPTRNSLHLLKQCIESILTKTTYQNYEIIVIDNNSDDIQTLEYFSILSGNKRIRIIRDERPFNYSALNNSAALQARGKFLCLMNNDIEVITPQWLDEMVSLAAQPGVGAVGACLWYPDDTLQHGGVILYEFPAHSHRHFKKGDSGYCNRLRLIQTLSAVTAACMVVQSHIYKSVGGLDEKNLTVSYNDVDFCLRLQEAGYRNVWTPYAELYHHESATRGSDKNPNNKPRFESEKKYLEKRWGSLLMNDPAYNSNLTIRSEDFSLAWPPRIGMEV